MDADGRRLLWRCRRGMKELDVLLQRYVRLRLGAAGSGERRALERLLQLPDPVLLEYLLGHAAPPEPGMARLAALIGAADNGGEFPEL